MKKLLILIILIACGFIKPCLGMLESVGIYTKDNKEIVIFGVEAPDEFKDEIDILNRYVEKWASLPDAPLCLFFEDKLRLIAVAGEIERLQKLNIPYSHMHHLIKRAVDNDFRYRNMRFSTLPTHQEFENQLVFFGNTVVECFEATKKNLKIHLSRVAFDQALRMQAFRKQMLKKGGFFDMFEDFMQKVFMLNLIESGSPAFTLNQYLQNYDATISKFRRIAQSKSVSDSLKKLLDEYLDTSDSCKSKLVNFYELYSKRSDESLVQVQMNALRSKAFITETYHEIRAATMPCIMLVKNLNALLALMGNVEKNPRIFSFVSQCVALQLSEQLAKLNFTAELHGTKKSMVNASTVNGTRRFTQEGLETILGSLFCQSSKTNRSNVVSQPTVYLNPVNNQESTTPFHDSGSRPCITCGQVLDVFFQFVITNEKQAYCSLGCFLKDIKKQSPRCANLQLLLDPTQPLSEEQESILRRCACIIHYCMLPLRDGISDDRGIFYNCNHEKLLRLLEKNHNGQAENKNARLWKSAHELAHIFGAQTARLSIIMRLGLHFKRTYLNELFTRARSAHYKALLADNRMILFDEAGKLLQLQKEHVLNLTKELQLSPNTSRLTLLHLYRHLIGLIVKRLKNFNGNFEEVLQEYIEESQVADLPQENKDTHPAPRKRTSSADNIKIFADTYESEEERENQEDTKPLQLSPRSKQFPSQLQLSDEELKTFSPATRKNYTHHTKDITSFFASRVPYTIKLFNARKQLTPTPGLLAAKELWKQISSIKESYRIKLLFGLLHDEGSVEINEIHTLLFKSAQQTLDSSVLKKLDLHHLFSHAVDAFISWGIAEKIDNLLQVSIPGAIMLNTGVIKVGFFQYTFVPATGMLIHRCFKHYDQNRKKGFISVTLRKALYDFLKEHYADDQRFHRVIVDLQKLVA